MPSEILVDLSLPEGTSFVDTVPDSEVRMFYMDCLEELLPTRF